MADPEHLGRLLKGNIEEFNEWVIEKRKERDIRCKFRHDLSKADIGRAYLYGVDLNGAILCNANLKGANLCNANLANADLRGANLKGADLMLADLSEADMRYADLSETHIKWTNLTRAKLEEIRLHKARFCQAILADVNLGEVYGLEEIIHNGPSSICIDTLYRSRGRIPEVFLRGAGVPELFVQHVKSLTMNPIEFYSCFISYSHEDKYFARRLHDQLQMRGIRCWLDEHQMLPGDDLMDQVDRGIKHWDKVLLCCSQNSLKSWWVDNEISSAFAKEQVLMKDRGKKILSLIPLNLDGYIFQEHCATSKKQQILTRLAADFRDWETNNQKFEDQFELVIKSLQTSNGREIPPVSKL